MIAPIPAKGTINLSVLISNSLRNLKAEMKSEKISIGKRIAKAWFNGIIKVIKGMDINDTDPPNPDFATPNKIIAGTTVNRNNGLISNVQIPALKYKFIEVQ